MEIEKRFHAQIKKTLKKSDRISTGAHFSFLTPNQPINCTASTEKAAVTPDGIVVPCSSMKDLTKFTSELSLFHHSIREIWENSQLFQSTRLFIEYFESTQCTGCNQQNDCNKGCLAQILLNAESSGEYIDPLCLKNFRNNYRKESTHHFKHRDLFV